MAEEKTGAIPTEAISALQEPTRGFGQDPWNRTAVTIPGTGAIPPFVELRTVIPEQTAPTVKDSPDRYLRWPRIFRNGGALATLGSAVTLATAVGLSSILGAGGPSQTPNHDQFGTVQISDSGQPRSSDGTSSPRIDKSPTPDSGNTNSTAESSQNVPSNTGFPSAEPTPTPEPTTPSPTPEPTPSPDPEPPLAPTVIPNPTG